MKTMILSGWFVALFLSVLCPSASAVMLNFDALPHETHLENQFRGDGVLFRTVSFDSITNGVSDVADHALVWSDPTIAVSGPNTIVATSDGTNPSQDAILLRFVVPGTDLPGQTDSVSILLDRPGPNDPRDDVVAMFARAYDGSILGVDVKFDTDVVALTIDAGVPAIHDVILKFIAAPNSGDVEFFDNLEFGNVIAVPEPSIGVLAIACAVLVCGKQIGRGCVRKSRLH